MKKALLLAAAIILAPMSAMAANYTEGVHYTVINDGPGTAKPEITEFFSFYCPHCFNFAKTTVPKIKSGLPDGVIFKQTHVEFMGKDMGVEMSRAFAAAKLLNVDEKIEPALFSAIHEKRQHFTRPDDIKALFVANGVDAKTYDAAINSFMVNVQVSKMRKDTENAKLSGVPSLVVNGKYRIEAGSIKTNDELLDIAFYLTSLKK